MHYMEGCFGKKNCRASFFLCSLPRHLILFCLACCLSPNICQAAGIEEQSVYGNKNVRHMGEIRKQTIENSTPRYIVHVEYPALDSPLVDAALTLWALQRIDSFTQGLEEIPVKDTSKFSLTITFELKSSSPKTASIIFFITTDTGTEDPETGMVTFNFNMETGAPLTYEKLFSKPDTLLPFLSLYCYKQLQKCSWADVSPDLLIAGTAPEPANFSLFALDPLGLTLYFPADQVAEFRFGLQQVTIPLSELQTFQPDMSLWKKGRLTGHTEKK